MIAVASDLAVAELPKSRRRPVARTTRPEVPKSVKIGLYISPESARRLGATALMESRDRSDIVDQLIRDHLRRYVIQDRGSRPAGEPLTLGEDRQMESVA
jgi:hypothetical protein